MLAPPLLTDEFCCETRNVTERSALIFGVINRPWPTDVYEVCGVGCTAVVVLPPVHGPRLAEADHDGNVLPDEDVADFVVGREQQRRGQLGDAVVVFQQLNAHPKIVADVLKDQRPVAGGRLALAPSDAGSGDGRGDDSRGRVQAPAALGARSASLGASRSPLVNAPATLPELVLN